MASYDLDEKSGRYHIRFRHQDRPFKRSVKLPDERAARTLCGRVEDTLRDLKLGRLTIPAGAEPGAFILSEGKVTARSVARDDMPLEKFFALYRTGVAAANKAKTTRYTEDIHFDHLTRVFGRTTPVMAVDLQAANRYVQVRRKEKWRGKFVNAETAKKELKTLRIAWAWGQKHGHLPAAAPFALGEVDFPKGVEKERFRTRQEIEAILARGGVKPGQEQRLWEGLYLAKDEVLEVLEYVRVNARHPFVHPMFCIAACTGARRSEIVRSRLEDWDLEGRTVALRQKKQDQSKGYTFRYVDVNDLLFGVMADWIKGHPGGASTLCFPDGRVLSVALADDYFERAIVGSRWENVLRGFHVFRHSFASLLAKEGVDQRVIDAFMGHSTEIRRRYQHLFPTERRSTIGKLLG